MRYPKMQTQPRTTVTVPQLNGGVNLNDLPNHVNDNQLTACNNVWWHDGALQTRPGLTKVEELEGFGGTVLRQPLNEREALIMRFQGEGAGLYMFYAALITAEGNAEVEYIGSKSNYYEVHSDHGTPTALGVRAPKNAGYDWLFYIDTGVVITYTKSNASGKWAAITPYEPLVMSRCLPQTSSFSIDGVPNEAFNVLTDEFKIAYTTDGTGQLFPLPDIEIEDYLVVELTLNDNGAPLTLTSGVVRSVDNWRDFKVLFDGLSPEAVGQSSETYTEAAVHILFNSSKHDVRLIVFCKKSGGTWESPDNWFLPVVTGNNLIFHLKRKTGSDKARITAMKRALWFGGDRSGTDSGTRLFLTGNPDKPNLLHWSDLNNPLYFPENNYAYIGDDGDRITALAKQGELLVIFRKHDIYCAQYVAGDVPTQEELESGTAAETTVHKAYFPLTQLHPNIGCDCPDTVRLVNNKLVWLTGDGRVHILTATNQYSERNVRQASPLIEKALKQHSEAEMQAAVAGEYEGYYVLLIGNRMYLLDCQTSAFNSFQSYSREETAQKALPWYIWTLPEREYTAIVYDGHGLVIVGENALFTMGGDTDDEAAIESSFTTKQYDFARVDTKKSIDQVYISVGDVEGCRIRVGYVTDRYTVEDAYVIECTGETDGSVQPYRVTPNVRLVQRFGLTLSAENPMAISGLSIKFKNQGVVR